MSKIDLVICMVLMMMISSCKQNKETNISEVEIWKLGWRMIESSMDDNLKQAEIQFDSLLSHTNKLDRNFLITGLEVKSKLKKSEEVIEIIGKQDLNMQKQLCLNKDLGKLNICKENSEEKVNNKELQIELIQMYIDDQACRGNIMVDLIDKFSVSKDQITEDGCIAVDERNRTRLKEIFAETGFPTRKLVGKDAMYGIFIMIQHSDGDKEWQKSQLPNIEKAVKNGDLEGQSYAYLYDRIKINSGEKQLYGSQFSNVDHIAKSVELAETEDLENLDNRRREMGMMPIEMYKRFMHKHI